MIKLSKKFLLTIVLLSTLAWEGVSGRKEVSDILDSLFTSKKEDSLGYYDKTLRPFHGQDKAVRVELSAYVLDLWNIDEINHEYTMQLYFRQSWIDDRLVFLPPPGISSINLNGERAEKLWVPDTFFVNERKSMIHENMVRNKFVRLQPDGAILMSSRSGVNFNYPQITRLSLHGKVKDSENYFTANESYVGVVMAQYSFIIPLEKVELDSGQQTTYNNTYLIGTFKMTVTASCPMNLKWFPFDHQQCTLEIESYGYTSSGILYEWKSGGAAVGVSSSFSGTTNFEVIATRPAQQQLSFTSGNYSRAAIDFIISRNWTGYVQDFYFPALTVVLTALLSLSIGGIQLRIISSVICLGLMVVLMGFVSLSMGKVSCQTAMDLYLLKCLFITFSILSLNFFDYYLNCCKSTRPSGMLMRDLNGVGDGDEENKDIVQQGHSETEQSESDFRLGRPTLDSKLKEFLKLWIKYSRYTIPGVFFLFNVIYWAVVLSNAPTVPQDFLMLEDFNQ